MQYHLHPSFRDKRQEDTKALMSIDGTQMKAYATRRASEVYCSDSEETMLQLFSCSEIILSKVKLPGVRQLFTKMKPFLSEYF